MSDYEKTGLNSDEVKNNELGHMDVKSNEEREFPVTNESSVVNTGFVMEDAEVTETEVQEDTEALKSTHMASNTEAYEEPKKAIPTAKELKKAAKIKHKEEKREKHEARKNAPRGFGATLARCACLAVIFGLVSGGIFYGVNRIGGNTGTQHTISMNGSVTASKDDAIDVSSAQTTLVDASDVVDSAMSSIVSISATTKEVVQNFFGQSFSQETPLSGSGIIIGQDDDYLYIATNNHVVEDATNLSVGFIDGTAEDAEVVGTSSMTDLAVVSVKKSDIEASTLDAISVAKLGNSDTLKVGEPTIAIGNALGYGQSVTVGVVSAVDRTLVGEENATALIQTDAAINPGNSGGALLNSKGEVIGINSSKYADTSVEGMGFAIPISTAEPVFEKIMTSGSTPVQDQGYLGIYGGNVEEDMAKVYNMPEGVYVTKVVEGEAAEAAGIKVGDIITGFNDDQVSTIEMLQEEVSYYAVGDQVKLVVQRNEDGTYVKKTITLTLSQRPQETDN